MVSSGTGTTRTELHMSDAERDDPAPAGEARAADDASEVEELAPELLRMLVCPLGKAELRQDGVELICTRCGPAFRIDDGIPILLIEESRLPDGIDSVDKLPCQLDAAAARSPASRQDG